MRAGAQAACLGLGPLVASAQALGAGRPALVGAHYYLWFPAQFEGGRYLRARLRPAQRPRLGEYSSSSAATVEQHIAWASSSGIDFFTLDYWPTAPERNVRIDEAFLAARSVDRIRFCIFYELGDLGYDAATGFTVFDGPAIHRFVHDMEDIARRYFLHPRQLRIDGRPVIVLYISRTATGRFTEAMLHFRGRMSQLGFDPFVIGDEVFWVAAREDGSGTTDEPQRGRIALFDAITAYNLYDSSRPSHAGYGAKSALLPEAHALFARYREAAPEVPLIPLALPGYNDRATRPEAGHYVIPRQWAAGAGEASFFDEWLRGFALPQLDPRLPMLLITSWNEWNEDTAIEPVAAAPPTASDVSESGHAYTQGFRYSGYESRYLEVLRSTLGLG
jgi:hypothetical protein